MKKNKDNEILELISIGEQNRALKLVFRNYFPTVSRLLKKRGGKAEDIEDMFQDAVFIFYKKALKGDLDNNSDVGSYLYTVTKNLWVNKMQRDNKSISYDNLVTEETVEETPYSQLISEEKEKNIRAVFAQLGARCEELLIARFYHGMKMKDIVENLGFKNEDSVKTQQYKCKQKLLELAKRHPWFIKVLKSA